MKIIVIYKDLSKTQKVSMKELTLVPVRLSTARIQLLASSYLRNAKPRDFPVVSSLTKLKSSTSPNCENTHIMSPYRKKKREKR
jgi:hypothetical protein